MDQKGIWERVQKYLEGLVNNFLIKQVYPKIQPPEQSSVEENKINIGKDKLENLIKEEINDLLSEGHGLSKKDLEHLKRIIDFLIKSNIEVDKTKDLSKGKK